MSAVLESPQRYAFSVEEYVRMGEAGVFPPDARLELIEGEIVEMPPIGSPHAGEVNILNGVFARLAGNRAVVAVQNPVIIGRRSMPQPDLAILKPRFDSYVHSHPRSEDVLLVIEVADSSLDFDLQTKIPIYARNGIAEAWVVNLRGQCVHVFRDPPANGYRTAFTVSGEASLSPQALPDIVIALTTLFPPAA